MSSVLPPIPFKSPMQDQSGLLTEVWTKFLLQLFNRTGGKIALTNIELAESTDNQDAEIAVLQGQMAAVLATLGDDGGNIGSLVAGFDGLSQGRQL